MMETIEGILAKHGSNTVVMHISEEPWSNYSESDYTLEQWHRACLIHLHDGPPTSKGQCKLPVRTPSGALNKNGVFAAAAALAGARGGVNAPADAKAKAARSLASMYNQFGKKAPPSVMSLMTHTDLIQNILAHYGIRGMHWGVRRENPSGSSEPSADVQRVRSAMAKINRGDTSALSNKELQDVVTRMNLDQQYSRLSSSKKNLGAKIAQDIVTSIAKEQLKNTLSKAVGKAIAAHFAKQTAKKAAQGALFKVLV
jgi:hypothetical protein